MTQVNADQGSTLSVVSGPSSVQLGNLSRGSQRQVARGLDHLSADVVLAAANQRAEAGLAMMRAQHHQEMAIFQEESRAQLAVLHERGRGIVAETSIQEIGATGAAADAVAKAFPIVSPQVLKIVDAQATGHALTVMRY